MRSVSFVQHIELEFSGNLFNEALLLDDIDNDGNNELVLGNVNGELFVFKGTSSKPWKVSKQDGMITCVGAGDLWNTGNKLLVCITADGWCHLFDVENQPKDDPVLRPTYSQMLPSNAKILLIADVDGDGQCELVTGHTDRDVHLHRWIKEPLKKATLSPSKVAEMSHDLGHEEASKTSPSSTESKLGKQRASTVETPRKTSLLSKDVKPKDYKPQELTVTKHGLSGINKHETGHFVEIKSWSLSSEITSLVLYKSPRTQYLLVSQPGGAFINLLASDIVTNKEDQEGDPNKSPSLSSSCDFPLSFMSNSRNPSIPTTLVTLAPHRTADKTNDDSELLAIGLLNGDLTLLNKDQIIWTLHLEQNLFSLSKLDVTSDGYEEIITCAWDGTTYIIDSERNIVKFQFHENVIAFGAGKFAVGKSPGSNVPCLVYVTFSNRVVIYWNITLSRMTPATLITIMNTQKDAKKDLEKLAVVVDDSIEEGKFQELVSKIFYGKRK